jgi:transcriptional regulator with XRE-family HTH domain
MPEPLWKIRERKGLSVNQLAAKSGVPAISISEYEAGRAIRSADVPRLAKALYVEEWEIELQSESRPKPKGAPSPSAAPREQKAREKPKVRPLPSPARLTQIEHLLSLTTRHFDKGRAALEEEVGKPLEEMTRSEASKLLRRYQQSLAETLSADNAGEVRGKRKRAYLPEGVDEFEQKYLSTQQESDALILFTLFDGRELSGYVIGFGPYSITMREEQTGEEITLQKLAIAYYRTISR